MRLRRIFFLLLVFLFLSPFLSFSDDVQGTLSWKEYSIRMRLFRTKYLLIIDDYEKSTRALKEEYENYKKNSILREQRMQSTIDGLTSNLKTSNETLSQQENSIETSKSLLESLKKTLRKKKIISILVPIAVGTITAITFYFIGKAVSK